MVSQRGDDEGEKQLKGGGLLEDVNDFELKDVEDNDDSDSECESCT